MKNAALKKFLAKNGDDAKKILKDEDEDDEPKKKLIVTDDPKWKGKIGKHDDCWK